MKKFTSVIPLLLLYLTGCSGGAPESINELLIKDVTLIDGTGAEPRSGVDIRIADGRIAEISPDIAVPADAEIIDGSGKYVVPGLIDAHVHMDRSILTLALVILV